jgi:hypothetical protein
MMQKPPSPGREFHRPKRIAPFLSAALVLLAACWSSGITDEEGSEGEVNVTVTLRMRGTHANLGPIDAHVLVYSGAAPLDRVAATLSGSEVCSFGSATTASCTVSVPRGSVVTLLATEGRSGIADVVRSEQPADTAHTGSFVEFVRWTTCPTEIGPGACAFNAEQDQTVGAEYDPMTQVVVYQVGTAYFDYLVSAPKPSLRVPLEQRNVLDGRGCSLMVRTPPVLQPCTALVKAGATPVRRITAYVTRSSEFYLSTYPGQSTTLKEWGAQCAVYFYPNGCAIVLGSQPDSTGKSVRVTLWYDFWQCSTGPEEQDIAGLNCTLVKP